MHRFINCNTICNGKRLKTSPPVESKFSKLCYSPHDRVYTTMKENEEDHCIMIECGHRSALGAQNKIGISVYSKVHFFFNSDDSQQLDSMFILM